MKDLPPEIIDKEGAVMISPKAILRNLIELDKSTEDIVRSVDTLLERCFNRSKEPRFNSRGGSHQGRGRGRGTKRPDHRK
jgi:hypothetical protein